MVVFSLAVVDLWGGGEYTISSVFTRCPIASGQVDKGEGHHKTGLHSGTKQTVRVLDE